MPNIETPSEFAQRFDPCARGEFIGVSEAVAALTARDAAIRAESAELLRVCGEALAWIVNSDYMYDIHETARATLAALREAGAYNG